MKPFRLLSSAASDNAQLGGDGRCLIRTIFGTNASSDARWLKLYDKNQVPSAVDVPDLTIHLPPLTSFNLTVEALFKRGFGVRITGAEADTDTTAIGVGDILGLNIVAAN